eukprot:1159146-Pelagomonas_calceolata.AAC.6
MEQLSMAFGTLQAQTARKQQQAAAGSATASESGFNPASFANGSNELSVADGMQHMPEGAKEFYKQVRHAATHAAVHHLNGGWWRLCCGVVMNLSFRVPSVPGCRLCSASQAFKFVWSP